MIFGSAGDGLENDRIQDIPYDITFDISDGLGVNILIAEQSHLKSINLSKDDVLSKCSIRLRISR